MRQQRGPHYSKKCPFYILPNQPLTAEKSVNRCVECVACGRQRLQDRKADLHQIAYLTILENSPKYDPEHQTGASLSTFIRSRVCAKLWNESEKDLKSIPCSVLEEDRGAQQQEVNRLVDGLAAESLLRESVEETVTWGVDVENFKTLLPQLLSCLSEKERTVVKMKFYEGLKAVEIARRLSISEDRVSQLSRSAVAKLAKAYLFGAVSSQ